MLYTCSLTVCVTFCNWLFHSVKCLWTLWVSSNSQVVPSQCPLLLSPLHFINLGMPVLILFFLFLAVPPPFVILTPHGLKCHLYVITSKLSYIYNSHHITFSFHVPLGSPGLWQSPRLFFFLMTLIILMWISHAFYTVPLSWDFSGLAGRYKGNLTDMEPGGQQGELAHHRSEISDPPKEPDVTFIVSATLLSSRRKQGFHLPPPRNGPDNVKLSQLDQWAAMTHGTPGLLWGTSCSEQCTQFGPFPLWKHSLFGSLDLPMILQ